jgi:hypothetical protein
MLDQHDAIADDLCRALIDGDAGLAAVIVGGMLDRGDLGRLETVSANVFAEASTAPAAADLLSRTVEEEAQSFERDGMRTVLFSIPYLLDPKHSRPLDAAAVSRLLLALSGPDDRVVVADGWVHLQDLLALDPVGYRSLARDMSGEAAGGATVMPLRPASFPRFPAVCGDMAGGAESVDCAAGTRTRVTARFVLAALVRPAGAPVPDCPVGDICFRGAGRKGAALLSGVLSDLVPGAVAMLVPAQPYMAAFGAAGAIDCIVIEARLKAVTRQIGRKPIAHLCPGEDWLEIVLTADGKTAVDAMRVLGSAINHADLARKLDENCADMVHHEDESDLPRAAAERTMH